MAAMKSCGFFIFVVLTTTQRFAMASTSSKSIKGAYYPSWASDFPPSAIDTTLFTHILYAFLSPSNVTFKFDISDSTAVSLSTFTSTLHAKNPPVKTLFSIGGGDAGHVLFGNMAANAWSRKNFIDSTIEVARKYGFDGIDLDWESPQNPKEMDDFARLLQEWRDAVQKEAAATRRSPLLLSAAVYFAADFFLADVYRAWPVDSIRENLDWIYAMCYDFHGSWDTSETGTLAALFDPKSNISTCYGLRSWLNAGLPRSKLVMGLPLYGRTWKLKDAASHGIGAPAVDVGPGNGTLTYSEVVAFNRANNATEVLDMETVSAYSFAGTSWISYDNAASTSIKVAYARALAIRGYFFWAVAGDYEWTLSRKASDSWDL